MINETINSIRGSRLKRRRRFIMTTTVLAIITLALCCAMLMLGNTIYPVKDVIRVLLGEEVKGATFTVGTLRLPRMLAGLFAGFGYRQGPV